MTHTDPGVLAEAPAPVAGERAWLRTERDPRSGALRRVLYVIALDPTRKLGTLEEQILTLASAFRQRGSLLLPLFSTSSPAEGALGYREAGLPVACLDLETFRRSTLRQVVQLVDQHRLEVVHWGMCPPLRNPYLWALSLARPRLAHFFTDHASRLPELHGRGSLPARLVKKLLLRRYGKVVGVSAFVADNLRRQGVWPEPTTCLHFVNTERFRPDERVRARVRQELGVEKKFVALTVAQLIREKGIHVLLEALPLTPAEVVVWVAGEGPEAGALRQQAFDLGVQDRVAFLGPQVHVEPYMQAADCLVCPSVWAEAAGLVNPEGQACGLPVVGSATGGIPEYVADGRTGLLFPVGDHEALAAHLRRLHGEPDYCRALGRQARQWAVERFSVEARLDDYLELYRAPPHPQPLSHPGGRGE